MTMFVGELQRMREMLVDERRRVVAEGLSSREANGEGGLRGQDVKQLQEQIEAIDRAISDEERLAGLVPKGDFYRNA